MGSVAEVKEEVLQRSGRYKIIAENLHAKEVFVGDGERRRRYIVCYNPREAKRQRQHREQVIKELEIKLNKHPDHRATARWAINLMASGRYKRYLTIVNNCICLDRQAVQDAARYDGKWVLITNDDTITLEDAASGYKGLLVIERCLPHHEIYPDQIRAQCTTGCRSGSKPISKFAFWPCCWPGSPNGIVSSLGNRIRDDLSTLQATEFQTPNFQFFQRNEPSQNLLSTLKSLEIPMPKVVLNINSTTTET